MRNCKNSLDNVKKSNISNQIEFKSIDEIILDIIQEEPLQLEKSLQKMFIVYLSHNEIIDHNTRQKILQCYATLNKLLWDLQPYYAAKYIEDLLIENA